MWHDLINRNQHQHQTFRVELDSEPYLFKFNNGLHHNLG